MTPFAAMRMRNTPASIVVGAVSFIAAFTSNYASTYFTATSMTTTVPGTAAANDLLVAAVMHRAAITPPSGWTLVDTISYTDSGTTQSLSMYKKVAVSGDVGAVLTWNQATSTRMAVHLESPRFLRRLNTLRGLSHEQVEQVLTRGP
jgi:hypothetical protein